MEAQSGEKAEHAGGNGLGGHGQSVVGGDRMVGGGVDPSSLSYDGSLPQQFGEHGAGDASGLEVAGTGDTDLLEDLERGLFSRRRHGRSL